MGDVVYKEEVFAIQGAIFEVYRHVGVGFLEAVYQEALGMEMAMRGIPFEAQKEIDLEYKGTPLQQTYRADFVCYGKIILELKAVKQLLPEHEAQLFNYLRAIKLKLGLLVNFCHYPKAEVRRIIL